jgi:hypothetical protein
LQEGLEDVDIYETMPWTVEAVTVKLWRTDAGVRFSVEVEARG